MESHVEEFLAPVNADNSMTQQQKDLVAHHVRKFVAFVEGREKAEQGAGTKTPQRFPVENISAQDVKPAIKGE